MKSLTVGIVIMRPKIQWMSIHLTDMMYRAMKFERLSVHFVELNKMFSKTALLVVFVWESTSVKNAISLMTRTQNSNTTVTDVEFAELAATIISSTVINVDVATLSNWRIATLVWKKQCTTTALCVLSIYSTLQSLSAYCLVVTLFTCIAWKRCTSIFNLLVQCAPNLSVICLNCGRNLTERLLWLQCLKLTRTKWFGSYAMIVE